MRSLFICALALLVPCVATAQEVPMPSLEHGDAVCPKGATWHVVKDRSPVPKCKLPRQMGCMLPDGRRHGPWTVMHVDYKCKFRETTASYINGHKTGPAVQFLVKCRDLSKRRRRRRRKRRRARKPPPRCKEQALEVGSYQGGKRAGQWLILDERGRKREHYTLTRGIKHGPFSLFNSKGIRIAVGCLQEDQEVWRYSFKEKELWNTACSTKLKEKPIGDGTSKVSDDHQTASKMVRLAQQTKNQKLKLMYLKKAVLLYPSNKRYVNLLKSALEDAGSTASSGEASGPASAPAQATAVTAPAAR